MRKLISENGGLVFPDMDTGTHAILPNFDERTLDDSEDDWLALQNDEQTAAIKSFYIPGVVFTAQWVLDCVKANMLLERSPYALHLEDSFREPYSLKKEPPKLTLLDLILVKKMISFSLQNIKNQKQEEIQNALKFLMDSWPFLFPQRSLLSGRSLLIFYARNLKSLDDKLEKRTLPFSSFHPKIPQGTSEV